MSGFWKVCSFLCTQYLVGPTFAWITASMRRGMESISLWHCSGVIEAQVALVATFRSSALLRLVSLIFLLTIPHRLSMGQNLLPSEKRTLDHWATVQLFFSLAHARCFWRFFSVSEVAWWPFSWRCLSSWMHCLQLQLTSCEALPSARTGFAWQYSQACGHPCCFCTFSYPISSFQSTLHFICFDTALLEQPPLSVMTLCELPSLWRLSMIIFCTIAKSAVFPIIVVSKNKRYP